MKAIIPALAPTFLCADPEALDPEGRTPMDHAAESWWLQGMEEVRRLLEAKGEERGQRDGH